jgi:hypothetical protein
MKNSGGLAILLFFLACGDRVPVSQVDAQPSADSKVGDSVLARDSVVEIDGAVDSLVFDSGSEKECVVDGDCGEGFCLTDFASGRFCHSNCIEFFEDRTFGCLTDVHCCKSGICSVAADGGGVCKW